MGFVSTRLKACHWPLLGLVLIVLYGCQGQQDASNTEKIYFDLAGFLKDEIAYLDLHKPTIEKKNSLDGQVEALTTTEVNWARELGLFEKADINKPAYKNSYQTDRPDSLTLVYSLKPSESLLVQRLQVRFDSLNHKPIEITGAIRSTNKLYDSVRDFSINIHEGHITSYSVEGYQRLAWMDKRPFTVAVVIKE
ncbi:hypothetical protein CLV98_106159 [Dyadobacter jejuensis]|uniref:Uncharacterized protein n=1 Tax=Dyadobacter jejuensis TaxID=1082580 RepID=A0A316B4Y2_9BACT|nr:hypothetical protein [Dyadobacter jejuensis]PWJ57687.1 hypothetical protein CLV98_106159 [Dyadobacter jejuensis]